MKLARIAMMVVRIGVVFQLVVGAALWSGRWYAILDLHRTVGVLFVIALFIVAGTALAAGRSVALAGFTIVWGLALAGMGFSQAAMMPGDNHWVIRVVHLAMGLLALPMAERLMKSQAGAVSV
jgi:hypothetical protein